MLPTFSANVLANLDVARDPAVACNATNASCSLPASRALRTCGRNGKSMTNSAGSLNTLFIALSRSASSATFSALRFLRCCSCCLILDFCLLFIFAYAVIAEFNSVSM